ncbi:MAG: hypothetical protein AAGI30_10035 [Planctomycetota bacterium]
MKKLLMLLVVLVLLAISAALGVGYVLFANVGASTWLAQYIRDTAQTYLVPTIDFDEFDLVDLKTARMRNTTFIAPDGTRVIECDTFEITFAGIPRQGQPVQIERIAFVNPTLRLIASNDPDTTFKGLVPFVKNTSESEQQTVQDEFKLSNLLAIRTLEIRNGAFEYDDGSGSPMQIDGLELDLAGTPTGTPGEYTLEVDIDRAPVLEIVYDGSVNIDTFAATIDSLAITASLDEGDYSAFPPQLQQVLEQADAKGELSVTASGTVDPTDPINASDLTAAADLTGLNVGFGEYRLPIDKGEAQVTVSAGQLTQGPIYVEAMGGRVEVTGLSLALSDPSLPGSLNYSVAGVDLRQALRTPSMANPPIAGQLNVAGSASFQAASLPNSVNGPGTLTLREGRLYEIPVVSDLTDFALDTWNVIGGAEEAGAGAFSDSADIAYAFDRRGLNISQSTVTTRLLNASATGTIGYDQSLDMQVNANPTGKVGELLSDATQQLRDEAGEVVDKAAEQAEKALEDATNRIPGLGGLVEQVTEKVGTPTDILSQLRNLAGLRVRGTIEEPQIGF